MTHDYQRLWLAILLLGGWSLLSGRVALAAPSASSDPQHPNKKEKADGHWGEDSVGFRWVEDDSRDARWNQMDTGPFMSSALEVPTLDGATAVVNKALSIRLGDQQQAAVCFDLERMAIRCGWTGEFLKYDPTRFGLISRPTIGGKALFTAPDDPGWGDHDVEYRGLYLHDSRVVISYTVNGTNVLESYWSPPARKSPAIVRLLEVEARSEPLTVVIADAKSPVAIQGDAAYAELVQGADQPIRLRILPCQRPVRLKIWLGGTKSSVQEHSESDAESFDLSTWTKPGDRRWGSPLVTSGDVGRSVPGEEEPAYVVDSVELPFENRFNALLFLSGHDFLSTPGKMAVCTVHGDVWLVSGIDETLKRVEWQRFATGLFQPLGLRIVNDQIYVVGRDQITRLWDPNNDGEADYYESFNNDAKTSPEGHDYSACLQTDAQGNFYYISEQGVHRVSKDGQRYETIATGLRNPNGLAVAADGTITAAPQEGEWTPASALVEITPGGYYGFGGPQKTAERSLGYDPPLCWIPRLVDNSTGGQVWVTSDRWGPLQGQLLNLSFGQCRLLLTLLEPRTWTVPRHWPVLGESREVTIGSGVIPKAARYVQGGSFSLPLNFQSGIMRGRFSPHDGQLYVTGLRGWLTTAAQDGCLQRVRYTGETVTYPTAIRTLANGLAITFAVSLNRENAEDPGNYQLQQWNYNYSQNYGSPDYKISDPNLEGADEVEVLSATLLDGKTVFLETADIEPAMQVSIRYVLRGENDQSIRNVYHHTINSAFNVRLDPSRLSRRPRTDQPSDELKKQLQRGLLWRFIQADDRGGNQDVRSWRGASLYVPAGDPVTPFLQPGPFGAVAEGYLRIPLPDRYTFSVAGRGAVRLRINHEEVLSGDSEDLTKTWRRTVPLKGGYNSLELDYQTYPEGDASLRLLWETDDFDVEPVSPEVLFHDSRDKSLVSHRQLREGRTLFANLRCIRCHTKTIVGNNANLTMPELTLDAPNLTTIGDRLQSEWITRWLINPTGEHAAATMPRFFDSSDADRQQALDIAAYLASLTSGEDKPVNSSETEIDGQSLLERGEVLFEDLGCLVCHSLETEGAPDEFHRKSLTSIHKKYHKGSVAQFLEEPHRDYQSSRMPDFKLTDNEVAAIIAFLEDALPIEAETPSTEQRHIEAHGNARRGRQIYGEKRCAACHQIDGDQPPPLLNVPMISGRPSSRGCLDQTFDVEHEGPIYTLTQNERDAIRAFLKLGNDSLARYSAAEAADRLVTRYSCLACHNRDGKSSNRPVIVAEEGRGLAPDPLPSLTWTGEKLQAQWTTKFLAGQWEQPLRPWMKSRMPCFPQFAKIIATGFAHQHGISTVSPDASRYDATLAEIGRKLTLQTGLDCRQCHGIGKLMPRGDDRTKLAPGINFVIVRDRMHFDSYRRFVLDPPRYDISVKMPKLASNRKTTAVTRYFGGDVKQQFNAIWHYLQHFDKHGPESLSSSDNQ